MWPRRSPKALSNNWISVVLSPGAVQIAEIRRDGSGQRPELAAWESIPVESDELDALKKLRARLAGRCTTLLRHGQYQIVQVEAPQVPADERREAVRWRIKDMLDFPVDQAGIDVIDIPGGGGAGRGPQVFGIAASHDILRPLINKFQDAKLPLKAIDIPEMALRNVAALFEEEGRGLALLCFDAEGGRLVFTHKQELYAARRIDIPAADLAGRGAEAPGGVFERVLLDVQRSLDNFDRNYSFINLSKLLVAPMPGVANFVEYLKANLYQPVELLDLAMVFDLGYVPALVDREIQGAALPAIGAALRTDEISA
jgi:MSHA biogenesis protein MshI